MVNFGKSSWKIVRIHYKDDAFDVDVVIAVSALERNNETGNNSFGRASMHSSQEKKKSTLLITAFFVIFNDRHTAKNASKCNKILL